MFIDKISKNIYTKFFNTKTNSTNKNTKNNKNNLPEEKRTFWESIQKLKPLVK